MFDWGEIDGACYCVWKLERKHYLTRRFLFVNRGQEDTSFNEKGVNLFYNIKIELAELGHIWKIKIFNSLMKPMSPGRGRAS
jgi:hypothetical protein